MAMYKVEGTLSTRLKAQALREGRSPSGQLRYILDKHLDSIPDRTTPSLQSQDKANLVSLSYEAYENLLRADPTAYSIFKAQQTCTERVLSDSNAPVSAVR